MCHHLNATFLVFVFHANASIEVEARSEVEEPTLLGPEFPNPPTTTIVVVVDQSLGFATFL